MVLFDDIFYPDNPQKRQEVSLLQGEIKAQFTGFKNAWNETADLMNSIFSDQPKEEWRKIKIQRLDFEMSIEKVGDILNKIKSVVEDTQGKLTKFIKDIGLPEEINLPENWEEENLTFDFLAFSNENIASLVINALISTTAAAMAYWYTYTAINLMRAITSAATTAISSVAAVLGGVLAGLIVGAAVFVITDLIASAITGAIEAKRLDEAIDSLKLFKSQVTDKIAKATPRVSGIRQSIQDGVYRIDATHLIWKTESGEYVIIEVPAAPSLNEDLTLSNVRQLNVLKQVPFVA